MIDGFEIGNLKTVFCGLVLNAFESLIKGMNSFFSK